MKSPPLCRGGLPLALLGLLAASLGAATPPSPPGGEYPYKWRAAHGRSHVLWLGGGHWHDTLATAAALRPVLEGSAGFHLTYTEETAALLRCRAFDVVVLHGMLAAIDPAEERALLDAVRAGLPVFVLHAASASFRRPPPGPPGDPALAHPEFYRMLGGGVLRHPPLGPVAVRIAAPDHPVTRGVRDFTVVDELFLFQHLASDNTVLLTAEFEGTPRPLAWTRQYGAGRVFHLALGHGRAAAAQPEFQQLLVQGLRWLVPSPAAPTSSSR